jgi:hypothetical protein
MKARLPLTKQQEIRAAWRQSPSSSLDDISARCGVSGRTAANYMPAGVKVLRAKSGKTHMRLA